MSQNKRKRKAALLNKKVGRLQARINTRLNSTTFTQRGQESKKGAKL